MTGTEWLKNYPEGTVVRRAYNLAASAHEGAKRENGEPYITHPLAVAQTVRSWGLDEASVAAALLHDVAEDTAVTLADIRKDFGEEIAFLVDGLTKLKNLKYQKERDVENMRRFILAFSEDLRVLIIKLADRLHNMQTLRFLPKERQAPFALETADIYAPLAYRLGMQKLSGELEDMAFPYIYPEEYRWLMKEIKETYEDRQEYMNRVLPVVKRALNDHGISPSAMDARAKRYYSLYKKLLRHNMNLNEIYDLVALRIIVGTVEECYAALGVIHSLWQPMPGRFKDYIARPKPNGYRSLHTTVFCLEGKILEIQIKTQEMHEENELGIAAHWAYEQVKKSSKKLAGWSGVKDKKELVWVQQLQNWQKAFATQKEFLEAVKVDFFKDRIFVFTPGNDVMDLPAGATPVDFAYQVHSQIGDTCVGAKVNGKIVPLTTELHSGDIVEIVTQKGKKPSEDWLQFAKTEMAKKHIRNALKESAGTLRKRAGSIGTEFKIVNVDRPGYLKEVTAIFARNKVNITFLNSQTDPRQAFSTVTLRTPPILPSKAEKLVVSLKKLPSTKEVNFRILF
jgi:guanosine-3',5'-bis(diphosphate) 3'-pyrophosphohydrolase